MKRKKKYSKPIPLKLVEDFHKEFPGCYNACDKLLDDISGDVEIWDMVCIPIAATNAIMQTNYNALSKGAELHILYSWRRSKQILELDSDLLSEIFKNPEISLVPVEALLNIPYNAFYIKCADGLIDLQGLRFMGFFVTFDEEYDDSGSATARELRISVVTENNILIPLYLPLIPESTIKESLENSRGFDVLGALYPDAPNSIISIVSSLVNIILYICCENADIRESEYQKPYTRKQANPRFIKDTPREIQKWDVGWRVGAQLRQNRSIAKNRELKDADSRERGYRTAGTPKRPHLRAAHFHHFWVGKRGSENRRLIVKWLSPITVNVDTKNEMVATIRKVR